MADENVTYPRDKDFPGWESREEYEGQIDTPRTRDYRIGKRYCFWCGAKKVRGKCPNPDCD